MEIIEVKKHIGKKCAIILKNNFCYTAVIPEFENSSFTIIGKFNDEVSIDCDFIVFINVLHKEVEE